MRNSPLLHSWLAYSGRTLDPYRHDLRGFFQWATDNNLAVLAAPRPQLSENEDETFVAAPDS